MEGMRWKASRLANGIYFAAIIALGTTAGGEASENTASRPNILLCLGDNHSWRHVAAYGDKIVRTPNIDRVAREGVRFTHAFCAAASCAPSRAAILTGQHTWRLAEGANLFGTLPARFPVYTDLLEQAGYQVGYSGKGWSPGSVEAGGRTRNPAGPKYESFQQFLSERPSRKPFCFWMGPPYRCVNEAAHPSTALLGRVEVPPFLPDVPAVREDFLRYYAQIEGFDAILGSVLKSLDEIGELNKTLLVVTCDNGMLFPRCYPNLYDFGTREYLLVRWGEAVGGGRVVDDFVSLVDLAPTFLEAAGLPAPAAMTGRSLMRELRSRQSGLIDPARDHVVIARERHDWCREGGLGYPSRAIRTRDFLYIRNYQPDRWPAGPPDLENETEGLCGDCDASATKDYMLSHPEDSGVRGLYRLAFARRPAEELYYLARDPYQMNNVAEEKRYATEKTRLAERLESFLKRTGDPRAVGIDAPWDHCPYYGRKGLRRVPGAYMPRP